MEAKKVDNGFEIGDQLFWSMGDEVDDDRVSLLSEKGKPMKYGKPMGTVVDFPGEYDVQGIGIVCFEAGDRLNYIARLNDEKIALVQDAEAFDEETFDEIDERFVTSEEIEKEVNALELEGKVTVLD